MTQSVVPATPGAQAALPGVAQGIFAPVIAWVLPVGGTPIVVTMYGQSPRFAYTVPALGVFSRLDKEPAWFPDEDSFQDAHGHLLQADAPAQSTAAASPGLRDSGLGGRAAAPLERAGITKIAHLAKVSRPHVAAMRGVSKDAMATLDGLLESEGLWWLTDSPKTETLPEISDDEAESIL